jgi:amino acid permease
MSVCDSDSDKTVHIFLGYFFIVNYCLGTGFLGVPFSFFYSGYLAAIPTLIVIAFFTWVTSLWLLEIMARAQVRVLQLFKQKKYYGKSELYFSMYALILLTTML